MMKREGWTYKELAEQVGGSNLEIYEWLFNSAIPRASTFRRLVDLFPELAALYPHVPLEVLRMDMEEIGAWVKNKRTSAGLSQRDLQFLSGSRNVEHIEQCKTKSITMQTLDRLCTVLCGGENHDDAMIAAIGDMGREYLRLFAEGLSDSAVAQRLCITEKSAKTRRLNTLRALNAHSTAEAVAVAVGRGLLPLDEYREAAEAAAAASIARRRERCRQILSKTVKAGNNADG